MVPGDFFSSLLMLCYCVLHALRHFVRWNCCIQAMGSTVKVPPCCSCTRNLLCSAAGSRKLYCNGRRTVTNGALAADFSHGGIDGFPLQILLKKCFKIVVFPLWRRDPVLELQRAFINVCSCCAYFHCVLQLCLCRFFQFWH